MRILALDLSKRAAGWALWGPADERPVSGVWELGSEYTSRGDTFARLHGNMSDLHALPGGGIDAIFYEEPLNLGMGSAATNADTLNVLIGLAMHAESWAAAMGCRLVRSVPMATWRRHFLGRMPRATKSAQLKDYAMERARQLGFRPRRHDEAEALGILDYACEVLPDVGTPPWRAGEILRPAIGAVA